MRGSWPPLLAAAAAFLLAMYALRERSTVLAIERERADAAALAADAGVTVADAFAWREQLGPGAPPAQWHAAVEAFAALRQRLGDGHAVVARTRAPALAETARAACGDATTAWQRFRTRPEALPGLRYLALRERFAARAAARGGD